MSVKTRSAPDGLYEYPTLTVTRPQTILVSNYRFLNMIAGVAVVLDVTGLAANSWLTIYNTSLATPSVACASLISGQPTITIPPGKKCYLSWSGSTFTATIE